MVDIMKTLGEFKKKIDPEIERFMDSTIDEAQKKDRFIADALRYTKKTLLSGGKRLRPAFMCYGYLAGGGKEQEKMLKASVSVELIHSYLLIHDDIIDSDSMRHGMDTVNARYEKIGKRMMLGNRSSHFGDSMAIIIGDMVCALGNQVLFDSKFPPAQVIKALSRLQEIVSLTVVGQAQDIKMGYLRKTNEEEVMRMYENKTARYTIEGPLHLGMILGGGSSEMLKIASAYAIPVGIAFQIQDDILGIFGSEKKLGKPVGSDIEEGKQTLLVIKAFEKSKPAQKKKLLSILGKQGVTLKEVDEARRIIIDSGALDYAKSKSYNLIKKGKEEIVKTKMQPEAKDFLLGVADYMISRDL
jgi:geranylgeranyl diphosphate synthase, type I